MSRYLSVAVLLLIASPALAAEFYVVKDAANETCSITDQKPDGTKLVMVGTQAYATKEEAKAAKKAARASGECKKPAG